MVYMEAVQCYPDSDHKQLTASKQGRSRCLYSGRLTVDKHGSVVTKRSPDQVKMYLGAGSSWTAHNLVSCFWWESKFTGEDTMTHENRSEPGKWVSKKYTRSRQNLKCPKTGSEEFKPRHKIHSPNASPSPVEWTGSHGSGEIQYELNDDACGTWNYDTNLRGWI